MSEQANSAFSVEYENELAIISIDVVGEKMNTLKAEFAEQISALLDDIESHTELKGIIITSAKPDSFVAGADIQMLERCESAGQATELSVAGQQIMQRLEELSIPSVAAIHGPALGGGLELALCCDYRVCSDDERTQLGLPEVQLGLLPGSGGTQRLPRLIGIQPALQMILTGKAKRPKQALKLGLADDVVPLSILLATAKQWVNKGKRRKYAPKRNWLNNILEKTSAGRRFVFQQAKKQTLAKTKGNYPAATDIIDVIEAGEQNRRRGYEMEAQCFGQLVMSSQSRQLRQIFFATTEMKKEQGVKGVAPGSVGKVGVLGGGLMGGGIAYVTAKAKLPVRIKDIQPQGIANAMKYSFDLLSKRVKRRIMSHTARQKHMYMLTGSTDYQGFADMDMVVEAVFEDVGLKQQMVKEVEQHCPEHCVFASNTSSIPIRHIAEQAKRPEQVVGLHYFSPVDKMPLVEVIPHEKTSDEVISTTVAFARKQGKTPIVVKDSAGFYVNRILAPYMNEAACLLLSGEPVEHIDKALVQFGFPVGPLKLLDEVGIDVGAKIGPILVDELGERFAPPAAFDKLLADDRKGKKNGRGIYAYDGKKAGKNVDESLYKLLSITPQATLSSTQIAERCVLLMLNEAARCLDEGVIRCARDGDIGAIFGIGFPPFLGGPFHYMDSLGISAVVEKLNHYQQQHGERYQPAECLLKMHADGKYFY